MKLLFITLLFIACSTTLLAQQVEVLNATVQLSNKIDTIFIGNSIETGKHKQAHPWQLLDSGTNTKILTFLGTIKIMGGQTFEKNDFVIMDGQVDGIPDRLWAQNNFAVIDGEIDRTADKLGANVLMLKEFYYDNKAKRFSFMLDAFIATDSVYSAIREKKKKNVIYIFPDPGPDWGKWGSSYTYRVSHKLIKIGYHEYLKYSIGINEIVRVNREGLYANYIKWEQNKSPIYIVRYGGVSSFFSPVAYPPPTTINYREGFGELLRKTIYRNYFIIKNANNKITLYSDADIQGKQ